MDCSELHKTLGFKIIQTGKALVKKINADFLALNAELTFEQMGVLYHLSTQGNKETIQQDIAEMMNKTKSAVLRSIDILEEKNYLTRLRKDNDRRMNIIQLTCKGEQILLKMQDVFLSIESAMSKTVSNEQERQCVEVLEEIKNKCH